MCERHTHRTAESSHSASLGRGRYSPEVRSLTSIDPRLIWLWGDAADGYPGLSGWGAKSSAAVLAKFSSSRSHPGTTASGAERRLTPLPRRHSWPRPGSGVAFFRTLATLRTDIALFDDVDQLRWKGQPMPSATLGLRIGRGGYGKASNRPSVIEHAHSRICSRR